MGGSFTNTKILVCGGVVFVSGCAENNTANFIRTLVVKLFWEVLLEMALQVLIQ
jgi:hypothetical protein